MYERVTIMTKQLIWKGFLTAASIAAMTMVTMTSTVSAAGRFSSTTSRDANNDICINFDEVEVTLPADWAGKCRMVSSSDHVSFYHLASNNSYKAEGSEYGGWLFDIAFSTTRDYVNFADYMEIGKTEEGYYYASFPTDVQAYLADAAVASEYFDLYADMDAVKDSMFLVYNGEEQPIVWVDPDPSDEYLLPQSSSEYLASSDIADMNKDQLQMAINEIYARHGRKFVLKEVQEYFDSCSWYKGTIDAADFDVNVMNQYEGANLNLMVDRMNELD